MLIQVIGSSNSGKTTLVERLLPLLREEGLRVGTIKHAHHGFEMDVPGKDSWRHTQAGAEAVVIVSPGQTACLMKTSEEFSCTEVAELLQGRVDLVLIEGFKQQRMAPSILLEPGTGQRLKVDAEDCRVGVHAAELTAEELAQLTQHCLRVIGRDYANHA